MPNPDLRARLAERFLNRVSTRKDEDFGRA